MDIGVDFDDDDDDFFREMDFFLRKSSALSFVSGCEYRSRVIFAVRPSLSECVYECVRSLCVCLNEMNQVTSLKCVVDVFEPFWFDGLWSAPCGSRSLFPFVYRHDDALSRHVIIPPNDPLSLELCRLHLFVHPLDSDSLVI